MSPEEKLILYKAKRSIARNGLDVYFTSKLPQANSTVAKLLFEDNKELVELAIKINPGIFEMFGYEDEDSPSAFDWICKDEKLIEIYSRWPDSSAHYIHPDYLLNHKDLVIQYIHNDATSYRWMDKKVRRDSLIAAIAVKARGDNLEHVPEGTSGMHALASIACKYMPLGLHFAPEKIRNDPAYIKPALETNPAYLVTLLRNNKELALNYKLLKPVIERDPSMMTYVSPSMELNNYKTLLLLALNSDNLALPKIADSDIYFSPDVLPSVVEHKLLAAINLAETYSDFGTISEKEAEINAKMANILRTFSQETLYNSWSSFLNSVKGKHIGTQLTFRIDKVFDRMMPYMKADTVVKVLDNLKLPSYTSVIEKLKTVIEKKRIQEIKQNVIKKENFRKSRKMLF